MVANTIPLMKNNIIVIALVATLLGVVVVEEMRINKLKESRSVIFLLLLTRI